MELRHRPYRVIPLGRIILWKLYQQHVNDEPKFEYTAIEISNLFSISVSQNLVSSALEFLRGSRYQRDGLVTRHKRTDSDEYRFTLSYHGILLVEGQLRNRNSDIAYFFVNGDSVIDEIAGINSVFMTRDEAMEGDPWTPLPIDRADPQYIETVAELETAIDVIRSDNGFAVSYPEERNGILATLEDGLKWLKDRTPSRAHIFSLLISPLQWIATNFSKAMLGEAAKKAAQQLVDYVHSFF